MSTLSQHFSSQYTLHYKLVFFPIVGCKHYSLRNGIYFFVKSQHSKKFVQLLFLGFRPFDWKILVESINQRVWSPKTKAKQNLLNNLLRWKSMSRKDCILLLCTHYTLYYRKILLRIKTLHFSEMIFLVTETRNTYFSGRCASVRVLIYSVSDMSQ